MRVQPFFCCKYLLGSELAAFECSDRILVCAEWYNTSGCTTSDKHVILKLSNILGEYIVGSVFSPHNDKGILYVPSRMYNALSISDNISILQVPIQPCTAVLLQPLNASYNLQSTWREQFVRSLDRYTTITQKTKIQLNLGTIEYFNVSFVAPAKYDTVFIKHGNEIDIRFQPSLETEKKDWDTKYHYKSNAPPEPTVVPFNGTGQALGGISYDKEKHEVCLQAAKNRMQKRAIQLKLHGELPEEDYVRRTIAKIEKPVLFRQTFQSSVPTAAFIGEGHTTSTIPTSDNLSKAELCLAAARRRQENFQRTASQGLGRADTSVKQEDDTISESEAKRLEYLNDIKDKLDALSLLIRGRAGKEEVKEPDCPTRGKQYANLTEAHAAVCGAKE
jgi:hypothetical protein